MSDSAETALWQFYNSTVTKVLFFPVEMEMVNLSRVGFGGTKTSGKGAQKFFSPHWERQD